MSQADAAYDSLYLYTLEQAQKERASERPRFILQHVVDAQVAQTAAAQTKPMTLLFALMGLYLHLEKGFTGREVQLAHMKLAKKLRRRGNTTGRPSHCQVISAP